MLQHLIIHGEDLRMVPSNRDELTRAVEKLREGLRTLPAEADPAQRRVTARWIGIGLLSLGHHLDARGFLHQALDLAVASGNSRAVIATELNLGDAYRYSGDAQAADAFYRRALDTSRRLQPELVDFALQHLAKHLMERGDLAPARAHLQEALQLRLAKGESELIESTRAALHHVEQLLDSAAGQPPRRAG